MVSIILTALLVLLPVSAQATIYYVSTDGNNNNAGEIDTPKRTIAHCTSIMVAGDTCYVRAGTYNEGVIRFGRSGTQSAPIRLLNYPDEAPIIVFNSPTVGTDRILIQNSAGYSQAIGWITVEGFEITNGHDGFKWYNLHDAVIRRNHIHDNGYMGMLGIGGLRILIEKNIVHHNGRFAACDAGTTTQCILDHGLYAHGQYYTVLNNIFYYHQGFGVQQNGSSSSNYSSSLNPSPEFAGAQHWIVANNTFAYSRTRGGMVVWGGNSDDARIENNIFYENNIQNPANPQGIEFVGAGGATGVRIRNNHSFASGSGATAFLGGIQPADLVTSDNVVNVSPPAGVNWGSNSLPASPDWRLTASAPVNMAGSFGMLNNTTNVVGAFKTLPTPTAAITGNTIELTYSGMNTATPIRNISSAGVSVACSGSNCPDTPVVSSATPKANTDTKVLVVISGITGNACVSANQNWTISYDSSVGTWTGNDNIGPAPGLHQKAFSFTSLAVTNQCDGTGPSAPTASHISYPMENGAGTTVSDTSGNNIHATLVGGATWTDGKTGFGVRVSGGAQQITIPYGSGINPTTQPMTWVVPILVASGQTNLTMLVFGPEFGTNQRAYICAASGTWRMSVQSTSCTAAGASNLSVDVGWNYLFVDWDATTDTVTLSKGGGAQSCITGTGGATRAYTSFTLPGNIEAPIVGIDILATTATLTYDDVQIFTSLQTCDTLYATWNPPTGSIVGTFVQAAVQAQAVYLTEIDGTPTDLIALNTAKKVVTGGALVWVFQIHCADVVNCDETAFRLASRKNGAGDWIPQPTEETAFGTWLWGTSSNPFLNKNARTTRIDPGSTCAVSNAGVTLLTASQVPSINLPQDGCVMLAWIVRYSGVDGDYFEHRVEIQGGTPLTTYSHYARANVIGRQAGGL